MYLIKRITPWLAALVFLTSSEVIFWFPKQAVTLALADLAVFLALWAYFARPKIQTRLNFLILPLLLIGSGHFIYLFLESNFQKQLAGVSVAFLLYFYLNNLFVFLYQTSRYQVNSLETISEYSGFLAAFMFYMGLFSLRIFINYPMSWLILYSLLEAFAVNYFMFWSNKIAPGPNIMYSAIGATLISQAFWSISLLPTNFYVNGAGLLAIHYAFINVALLYLQAKARPGQIAKFVLISGLSLLAVYLTASWV